MRCISLWQPWATLIALGVKRYETRHWATSYRGPIAIHAAKTTKGVGPRGTRLKLGPYEVENDGRGLLLHGEGLAWDRLPLGAVVAVAYLGNVEHTEYLRRKVAAPGTDEACYGDFSDGRFGWRLENVQALREPLEWRGEQGFFDVPGDVVRAHLRGEVSRG